jgi:hypothetical protein
MATDAHARHDHFSAAQVFMLLVLCLLLCARRSNVVTEDIDKLFVKRSVGSSTAGAAGTASTSAAAGPGLQATPP